ncbi:heme-dependent oxidative N-demethylase family protein [Pseudooceanicola aestuarii]|uniref:heme-dependent oxidative N-demethylase family protein n=1 Tax=Pseudooceanicola aestuarii TaxID=2697319 RepID=UPI0013D5822F|nr:DUF3445 domain-containing protein [Pseudooceanicola aestuarii]
MDPHVQPAPILQTRLPYDADGLRPLPGIAPLAEAELILRDEAHAPQMALRDRLLADHRAAVTDLRPGALPAAQELLEEVLNLLCRDPGYVREGTRITRPDGTIVALDPTLPLITLGRLVQQDFCLLEKPEGAAEHVLTGAVLCFPSSWTLAEKIGHPLVRIHRPVDSYDENIAKRVQRLFDGVQTGRPLWRFNHLPYEDFRLFQPRREGAPIDPARARREKMKYLRSERQTLWRLPSSRAVVFGIHTFVLRRDAEQD